MKKWEVGDRVFFIGKYGLGVFANITSIFDNMLVVLADDGQRYKGEKDKFINLNNERN